MPSAREWESDMGFLLALAERELAADTPSGANAPYKIIKTGTGFKVSNNTGETKATFKTYQEALKFLRALYVNVPGAAKRADKVKFTGKARQRIPKGN
jgi:hypothetical protein